MIDKNRTDKKKIDQRKGSLKFPWMKRVAAIVLFLAVAGIFYRMDGKTMAAEKKDLTILFTHDLHSYLESFTAKVQGQEQESGGFARLKTFIDQKKQQDPDTLVVDGGDFSMGTLYQTIFETRAPELRLLGAMGVDVTTIGNHEFDYRTKGLTNMLHTAMDSGDPLPSFVLCNVDWEETLKNPSHEVQKLKEAFDRYEIVPYLILEKGEVRIAITGVFGKDALECAPTCELVFKDPVQAVKETVAEIQKKEQVDFILCLSHSGTWENPKESEDEILAKEVPELDVIVSGHTHSLLEEPIVHGDTLVVSAGEYGKHMGAISLSQNEKGRWQVTEYEVVPMTAEIPQDETLLEQIEALGATIDGDYLSQFGYTKDQVLAYNPWKNPTLQEMSDTLRENPFTNLLADSYMDTLNKMEEFQQDPVDVAIVPSGIIRDVFSEKSEITVSDVFDVFSLGIGPDGVPGYPLLSIYLTGKELKTVAEVDASISPIMDTAQLYMSGLTYTLNPNRLILNKVTEVHLTDFQGNKTEIQDEKLYRVVADLYSGQMLGAVSEKSFGILSVVPKDALGNPIENLEEYIVYRDGKEVKAWVAVANYVEHLALEEGNGEVPSYYNEIQNRKIIEDDKSIGALLKNPNQIALAFAGILAAVIFLVVLIGIVVVRMIRKRRKS